MKQDEAEKLARKLLAGTCLTNRRANDIRNLCDYILSGDMKREIENAAYLRVLSAITDGTCDSLSEAEDRIRGLARHLSDCAVHNGPALPVGPCDCGALITPAKTADTEG